MPPMATTASRVICRLESNRLRGLTASRHNAAKPMVFMVLRSVEEAAEQIESDHPQRALHRRGEAGEERVGEGGNDGKQRGRDARQAEPLGNPEDAPGHNGQMEAGDHQHMKGAGALKAHAQGMGEIGAVACNHGGEHDGVVGRKAQRWGQTAHGCGQGQQAGAGGVLQFAYATGERLTGWLT